MSLPFCIAAAGHCLSSDPLQLSFSRGVLHVYVNSVSASIMRCVWKKCQLELISGIERRSSLIHKKIKKKGEEKRKHLKLPFSIVPSKPKKGPFSFDLCLLLGVS